MPLGRGLSGSETKYIVGLSPTNVNATASAAGTARQLGSDFNWMTLLVNSAGSGTVVKVQRSASSSTGFADTGLSVLTDGSGLFVRSMPLNASPTWYRVNYSASTGSRVTGVTLELSQPRRTPITQDSATTVFSTVLP